ncbi:MAG: hypothetical protein A2542_04090 [Parcubacteria group bacterium RIFOXYD2_FULL_52_8]|nr:MAG: hypothetical protein A2542_04090 [Parcubacteria group bacterium RIFOXYD2_FULL_52_8]
MCPRTEGGDIRPATDQLRGLAGGDVGVGDAVASGISERPLSVESLDLDDRTELALEDDHLELGVPIARLAPHDPVPDPRLEPELAADDYIADENEHVRQNLGEQLVGVLRLGHRVPSFLCSHLPSASIINVSDAVTNKLRPRRKR